MTQQVINIGNVANDGDGDPLRTAFDKTNDNFTELYNSVAGGTGIQNGSSNIAIVANSTINMSSTGVANVIVVSGTGVTITGTTVNTGNISATGNVSGNVFIGNGAALTGVTASVPASTLTGNTLSSNVLTASLTTVGTLGSKGERVLLVTAKARNFPEII